jgi:thiamine-phosphate pyrophosphorylase
MNGLLFISHRTPEYDYIQSIRIALEGGCREIQLRMKEEPYETVEQTAAEAKKICDRYEARLYINDYPEICKKVRATGVHLGKKDLPPPEARSLLGNKAIIGGTANTPEDIERLYKAGVNYIGLGPYRFTATKKNLSPVLGLEGYTDILHRCKNKKIELSIMAIGGITKDDIIPLMETGITGIALSSAILQSPDPIKETREIIDRINSVSYNKK